MILLGERPGLGTGDGLSAYVVYNPKVGKTDGDRNMISNIHARGTPIDEAATRLAALAAAMIEQKTSGVALDLARLGLVRRARAAAAASSPEAGGAERDALEPISPTILSVRRLPRADPAMVRAYGGDPDKHVALGLVTVDQDDPTYVALDEATKHAPVDVIFAKSFYAGAAHASGRLSGEILGVIGAADPESIDAGLAALVRCLAHDACFYAADAQGAASPCSRT